MDSAFWRGQLERREWSQGALDLAQRIFGPSLFQVGVRSHKQCGRIEALILGLQTTRYMNIHNLIVFGDSLLVVRQVKNQCQAKHPRLRAYRNEIWNLVENLFLAFKIQFMMRDKKKQMVDSLAVAASNFCLPQNPLLRYELDVRYRPSIPDNVKQWKVFEDE